MTPLSAIGAPMMGVWSLRTPQAKAMISPLMNLKKIIG